MTNVLSIENALNWSWGVVVNDLIRLLWYRYKFIRIVRRPKIDIDFGLLEHFPVSVLQNVDNMSLIKRFKRKVVCRMGGMVLDKNKPGSRYDNELAQAGAVVGTNRQLYDIGRRVNGNSWLIPNGVDVEKFRPNPKRPKRKFTVGFAGNIWGNGADYKGWKEYVMATMLLEGDVLHKECLHNGPTQGQRQISHKNMTEEFYWMIDCLILPSKGEGCSNVTGEALACGVPVLTTKVGYHGENLSDGENVLFIERNAEDIAEKVRMIKGDRELWYKLSVNGRKFVEQNQNIEKVALEYDRVFRSVLSKV